METLKAFGLYLVNLREKSGFKSQRQLSLESGISTATLSRIEAGTQKPQPETLKVLARYLKDVTYEELLEKTGYLTAEQSGEIKDGSAAYTDQKSLKVFAESLASLRTSKNLSLQKLAEEAEIDKERLQQYEAGNLNPIIEDITKLAAFFGVSTDRLLGQERALTKENIAWELAEHGIIQAFYDSLKDFDELEPEQQQFILQQMKQSIEMFKKMKTEKKK